MAGPERSHERDALGRIAAELRCRADLVVQRACVRAHLEANRGCSVRAGGRGEGRLVRDVASAAVGGADPSAASDHIPDNRDACHGVVQALSLDIDGGPAGFADQRVDLSGARVDSERPAAPDEGDPCRRLGRRRRTERRRCRRCRRCRTEARARGVRLLELRYRTAHAATVHPQLRVNRPERAELGD